MCVCVVFVLVAIHTIKDCHSSRLPVVYCLTVELFAGRAAASVSVNAQCLPHVYPYVLLLGSPDFHKHSC